MKKQTKVLLAAAMMTMGATFSAMAAETKGTWVLNEEGWQYADKDGDYMDNVWAMSNGIEFWVNDDEVLGSSEWVQDPDVDGRWYYALSDGSKLKNDWKQLYAFDDEDEEGDLNWYYFDAKGRMLKNTKKEIKGYTYYFDENGKMLTGWVDTTDKNYTDDVENKATVENLVYCDENGALVKSSWLEVFAWDEKDGYEGESENYYYAKKDGAIANGKTDIEGLTYFFNNTTGVMLDGWVVKGYGEKDVYTSADAKVGLDSTVVKEAYWTDEAGYAKKNSWREAADPIDEETYWYHFDKLGRAFLASAADCVDTYAQTFVDGEDLDSQLDADSKVLAESKKINGVEYFFNQKGEMLDGFQMIDGKLVYLEEGAKATGKVTLTDENENDYTFYFGEKKDGVANKFEAVTGNYKNYIYINGQLITSEDSDSYRIVPVGDQKYVVDHNGKVQHKDGKDYGFDVKYDFNDDDSIKGVHEEK